MIVNTTKRDLGRMLAAAGVERDGSALAAVVRLVAGDRCRHYLTTAGLRHERKTGLKSCLPGKSAEDETAAARLVVATKRCGGMDIVNVDTSDTITLDANANFKTVGGLDIALDPYGTVRSQVSECARLEALLS